VPSAVLEEVLWLYRERYFDLNVKHFHEKLGDLGYYVGYRISKAYYENSCDKRQAVRDVLNIRDFQDFFRRSRYA